MWVSGGTGEWKGRGPLGKESPSPSALGMWAKALLGLLGLQEALLQPLSPGGGGRGGEGGQQGRSPWRWQQERNNSDRVRTI